MVVKRGKINAVGESWLLNGKTYVGETRLLEAVTDFCG
jgi:hypothetical protein